MKILYIEARRKLSKEIHEAKPDAQIAELLSKKGFRALSLLYSIQYKSLAETLKSQLSAKGFKILLFSQVLGCTKLNLNPAFPVLLMGSGRFHALNLALQTSAPVYIYNSASGITQIDKKDIERIKTLKKAALASFFNYSRIGILVSTKPGQEKLEQALKLKAQI